jgi:thiol-disulfide isomerase/thioredoxin
MRINNLKYVAYAIFLLLFCTGEQVLAQTPTRLGPGPAEEINKALRVVEAHMDSLIAHRNYIFAMGMNNPLLLDQYEVWMKKYPSNVNIPLAIGTTFHRALMPQPKDFLLRAAAMDPKNAKIWYMLGADADMRSQNDMFTAYMGKAVSAEPSNADYAYGFLKSFENSSPETYKTKVFDFAKRFPEDQRGASAIFYLGQRATNLNDKIQYFEELHKRYPPQKFKWSSSGMIGLADAYLQTDTKKALLLINQMGEEDDWKIRKQMAESLIKIDQLEKDQNYKDAIITFDQIQLPGSDFPSDFSAMKRASLQEKIGDVKGAYDSLSIKFAKLPTDALYIALKSYGKKIGKDKEQVDNDIEMIRNRAATAAYSFDLGLYTSKETLNLNALKGKVILLTFWFPGCLPCRVEFPHFQTVVDSFKGESLVYIGINVLPSQDGYVLPFMKNTSYSFIPLRSNFPFAKKNYGVTGAPANFLIDKDGKIVFKDFRISGSDHRTLELMISSLLEKESVKQ